MALFTDLSVSFRKRGEGKAEEGTKRQASS
jgi:hypothetical protein